MLLSLIKSALVEILSTFIYDNWDELDSAYLSTYPEDMHRKVEEILNR